MSSISSDPDYRTGPIQETLTIPIHNLENANQIQLRFLYTANTDEKWWGLGKIGVIEWQCKDSYYFQSSSLSCQRKKNYEKTHTNIKF